MSTGALLMDIQLTPTRGFMFSRADSFVNIRMWSSVLVWVPELVMRDCSALVTESTPYAHRVYWIVGTYAGFHG